MEVRIAEDGEIFVRGPNVMKGYYKMPEATAEVLSPDGWFATGDIGHADADGFLYITDRKKELIVTAGGKNVAPQPIENLLKTNKYVSQVVLIGDNRPYITALIVPNWGNVVGLRQEQGRLRDRPGRPHREPQVIHLFQHVLERANAELSRYEQIKTVQAPTPRADPGGRRTDAYTQGEAARHQPAVCPTDRRALRGRRIGDRGQRGLSAGPARTSRQVSGASPG